MYIAALCEMLTQSPCSTNPSSKEVKSTTDIFGYNLTFKAPAFLLHTQAIVVECNKHFSSGHSSVEEFRMNLESIKYFLQVSDRYSNPRPTVHKTVQVITSYGVPP